jgi:hypothetical protein
MEIFGKRFRNIYPHSSHTLLGVLLWKLGLAEKDPPALDAGEVAARERPTHKPSESVSVTPMEKGTRVAWIGHSTFLIQHHGINILTDPIFGDCGPLPIGALRRVTAPGISLDRLPKIHHWEMECATGCQKVFAPGSESVGSHPARKSPGRRIVTWRRY